MESGSIFESCLWDELSDRPVVDRHQILPADVDVVIVGAGFTGLWTAFYLSRMDAALRIAVVERSHIGFGASGRNGGWCSSLLPMSLDSMKDRHGVAQTVAMQQAMFESVEEIERQTKLLGIDCDFARGGSIELLRSPGQVDRAEKHLSKLRSFGFGEDRYRILNRDETRNIVEARRTVGGFFDSTSAVLHPKKLVDGLARVVRSLGVSIFENVEVLSISKGSVITSGGEITCRSVLRTTEAFTSRLAGARRELIPLYSMMIATEPLSNDLWDAIGLSNRTSFNDGRNMIIYGQRTLDGRLAFGGRGAPYHFGSKIDPKFDFDQKVAANLRRTLLEIFPILHNTSFTHHWGGPLGAPRDWTCSVAYDRATGLGSAGGYVGDGVTTSNLAGRTLARLVTNERDGLTQLPWVDHQSRKWEPEPVRWIAVNALTRLAGWADWYEAKTGRPSKLVNAMIVKITSG